MNRSDRRKEYKKIPGWMKRLNESNGYVQSMVRNGIKPADLEKAAKDGYAQGLDDGKVIAIRTVYAAAMLAMNEVFGFGEKRCLRFLKALDDKVLYSITDDEQIDEVFEKFGVKIQFTGYDAIEGRVTENA